MCPKNARLRVYLFAQSFTRNKFPANFSVYCSVYCSVHDSVVSFAYLWLCEYRLFRLKSFSIEMSILTFFKPKRTLPTAENTGLSEHMTREANKAVESALQKESEAPPERKKRKYTTTFSPEDRAEIGKYASECGNAAAVRKYNVGESTVRLFKKKYLEALHIRVRNGDIQPVTAILPGRRGRPLLLGELDKKVQAYIQALRDAGGSIGSRIVIAAAEGIVLAHDRTLLVQHGGHIHLTRDWALSLLSRMGFVKRKATTKADVQITEEQFQKIKHSFLHQVVSMVKCHKIPTSLVINLDQTGLNIVPSGEWTMEREGSKRVELAGLGDKRQITATFAVTLNGQFLPMQLLYQGKTSCCHPRFNFPCEFDVFHTPNHWANEDTCIRFTENILMPYITKVREELGSPNQPALLIMDKFRGQMTNPVQENLEDHKILVVAVPAGTTDKLQPLDLSVNKAAKDFLRDRFHHWYAEQVMKQLQDQENPNKVHVDMTTTVMKELSAQWLTALYDNLRGRPELISNGFKEAGIMAVLENQTDADTDEDPFADLD